MTRASLAPVVDLAAEGEVLRCPRCTIPMSTYERSGVLVDQCPDCRGMFLDRGELERLVDAESGGWTGPRMRAPEPVHRSLYHPGRGYRSEWADMTDGER